MILCILANVHIIVCSKGLVLHLQGVTMRPSTVLHCIDLLRRSGYAGYGVDGVNSPDEVDRRTRERYMGKCQVEQFALDVVKEVVDGAYQAKLSGPPTVFDKSALRESQPLWYAHSLSIRGLRKSSPSAAAEVVPMFSMNTNLFLASTRI